MRHVPDEERRARLAVRHALAPGFRASSAGAATRAVTVLHATEPATVYLSCWARVDGITIEDIDAALFTERSLVKQLAMRRTLFVFPRDLLPAAWPSASARVARTERLGIAKEVVKAGLDTDGEAWVARAREEVLAALAGAPDGLQAAEVRKAVPMVDVALATAGMQPVARVLTHLGLTSDIVRGGNTGHWRVSRHRWVHADRWLGDVSAAMTESDGYRELVRRWLVSFGPGTENDIVWWLGATKGIVRAALTELGAVEVSLDGGGTGWLLPDDLEPVADPGPWVALLPVLDPTVMGWKDRDFYLGPHRDQLFDRNGNAGTTAWVDGRAVGYWRQATDGAVEVHLLEPISAAARKALDAEASRLTAWLDGTRVGMVYQSPAMKSHAPAG